MRFLLGSLIMVGASFLLSHGFLSGDAAASALGEPGLATMQQLLDVESDWPYSSAAALARRARLERGNPLLSAGYGDNAPERAFRAVQDSWRDRAPFLLPPLAAALGAAALALAVVLPGTRFRGLSLLALITGLAALYPAFSDPEHQTGWAASEALWVPLMTEMPRISAGMLLLSGFLLGAHRSSGS